MPLSVTICPQKSARSRCENKKEQANRAGLGHDQKQALATKGLTSVHSSNLKENAGRSYFKNKIHKMF